MVHGQVLKFVDRNNKSKAYYQIDCQSFIEIGISV